MWVLNGAIFKANHLSGKERNLSTEQDRVDNDLSGLLHRLQGLVLKKFRVVEVALGVTGDDFSIGSLYVSKVELVQEGVVLFVQGLLKADRHEIRNPLDIFVVVGHEHAPRVEKAMLRIANIKVRAAGNQPHLVQSVIHI